MEVVEMQICRGVGVVAVSRKPSMSLDRVNQALTEWGKSEEITNRSKQRCPSETYSDRLLILTPSLLQILRILYLEKNYVCAENTVCFNHVFWRRFLT